MAKSVGRAHYVAQANNHILDGTSLVNSKTFINNIDAILVLIELNYFPQRGAQERDLTNLHHGGKSRTSYHRAATFYMTTLV